MKGELYINGWDAYNKWGAVLADTSLSALMTPAPLKSYITNECAASNGIVVANAPLAMPKVDSRTVQLTIFLYASTKDAFYANYDSFVAELQKGKVQIKTKYQPDTVYKLLYESCSQFSQFNGKLAKLTLRMTEPNPTDRNADD